MNAKKNKMQSKLWWHTNCLWPFKFVYKIKFICCFEWTLCSANWITINFAPSSFFPHADNWKQFDSVLYRLSAHNHDCWRGMAPSHFHADFNPEPPIFAAKFANCNNHRNILAIANEDGKVSTPSESAIWFHPKTNSLRSFFLLQILDCSTKYKFKEWRRWATAIGWRSLP